MRSVSEIDLDGFAGTGTASPGDWADEVIYFLLVDRFSDGAEDGYRDAGGHVVSGTTPRFAPDDEGDATTTGQDAARWRAAGASWVGGTLAGARTKLGYLRRLGVTAVWLSPVLRQVETAPGEDACYHGYATQDFLEVDPHYGTAEDLRALVADAHGLGMRVILDVVLNHAGDVFAYATQTDRTTGEQTDAPTYSPDPYEVDGWRVPGQPPAPFNEEAAAAVYPRGAVWPAELTRTGVFSAKGRIRDGHWDDYPETSDGDFFTLKDVHHGDGEVDRYRPSPALAALTRAYQYWLGFADLDGFRVDTVKHMDRGATRFFASAIHEYAQVVGKDRFWLIGEVAGSRELGIDVQELTGLDAVLGLGSAASGLVDTATGARDPGPAYFDLFRNSELIGKDSHTWLRNHVVTSYDDHDQIRQGASKARFAGTPDGRARALAILALNVLTLGIPCVYYGSEQLLDGAGGNDRYIREALFGGAFGAFRSRDRHVFDEAAPTFRQLADLLAVRAAQPALRRGRQYLRQISGDGVQFGYPTGFGGPVRAVVAWSRLLAGAEVLCAVSTDASGAQSAWVVVDAEAHRPGDTLRCLYRSGPDAPEKVAVEARGGGAAVRLSLPPAGVAVYG